MSIIEFKSNLDFIRDFIVRMNREIIPQSAQKIMIKIYAGTLNINLTDSMADDLIGKTYEYVLAARIVQSLAASFLWVSVDTMVSDGSTDAGRSRNFGIVQQCTGRGQVTGAAIGFTLLFCSIFDEPFTYIFGIYFLTSLLALYNGLRFSRETLSLKVHEHNEEKLPDKKFIVFVTMMGILSAVQFAAGIGGIIGPLTGGIIYQKSFSGMVFYTQGILLAIAAVLIGVLLRKVNAKAAVNQLV